MSDQNDTSTGLSVGAGLAIIFGAILLAIILVNATRGLQPVSYSDDPGVCSRSAPDNC